MHRRRKENCYGSTSGFTLVEMAIVIPIFGLLLAGAIVLGRPLLEEHRAAITQQNMQHIINVTSVYAQRNNRIPCPADSNANDVAQPTGAEVGSGPAGTALPVVSAVGGCVNAGVSFNEGIVPYRTLGMSVSDVRDGNGNYITYHVNANFARDPNTVLTVHAYCRASTWFDAAGTTNINPMRAQFCCANNAIPGQTITVKDTNSVSLFPYTQDANANDYQAAGKPYPGSGGETGSLSPATTDETTIAFVLVSHGAIGGGAFLDVGGRAPANADTGTSEATNSSGGATFVWAQKNASYGANHFDDILMWRTQDQVYAETGTGTCALP